MKRWRISDERGLSLVETVMVLLILSFVLVFVAGTFGSLFWTTERTELRLQNLDEARLIVNGMTKDIRTATRKSPTLSPFDLADIREMIFYANLNSTTPPTGPRKVRLYVDASDHLVQEITLPDAACALPSSCTYTGAPTSRVLGYYVVNPSTIFTYIDDSTAVPTQLTSTPLSASDLLKVTAVQVSLTIRKQTNFQVPAVTLVNRVRLTNVEYNPLGS